MGVSDGWGQYCFIRIALAFYTLISMKLILFIPQASILRDP
jgi:hypothetical protein